MLQVVYPDSAQMIPNDAQYLGS